MAESYFISQRQVRLQDRSSLALIMIEERGIWLHLEFKSKMLDYWKFRCEREQDADKTEGIRRTTIQRMRKQVSPGFASHVKSVERLATSRKNHLGNYHVNEVFALPFCLQNIL